MDKYGRKSNSSLLQSVQERLTLKEALEEKRRKKLNEESFLSRDCISCILVRLPIDSLQRSCCVCKLWYEIIHSPVFIQSHVSRSEPVILFQTSAAKVKATAFSVEKSLVEVTNFFNRPVIGPWSQLFIQFMEAVDDRAVVKDFNISCLGKVLASCDGLILLQKRQKKGGVILMNPVTRQVTALCLGTIAPPHKESYSLVFDPSASQYKVVHLFTDESQYISCEILVVGARFWKMVNGPSFGLISWFGYKPVSAIGALHWLPQIDHNVYIVSMETRTERFQTIELPKSGRIYDRIFEMGGFLCFSAHGETNQIDIWALKELSDGNWTRLHSITVGYIMDMVPVYGSRSGGQIIFTRHENGAFYAYDLHQKTMSAVEMTETVRSVDESYFPHVNSLVSWSVGGENKCM